MGRWRTTIDAISVAFSGGVGWVEQRNPAGDFGMFLKNENDVESGLSVVIEDDGRVCYAYLLSPDRQIVGDV